MPCPQCQHVNPEDARFCNACGTTLQVACSTCAHGNPPGSRFCNACGQHLLAPSSQAAPPVVPHATPVEPAPPHVHPPAAERRQLTVMFCDLVGSTPLSTQLDPEDLRDVVRAYQETCTAVVERFEGHVAQLLGDALLVYFGWPQAHEDDAQRAVRTGLGMLDAMGTLNTRLAPEKGVRLAIRVGIHTGLVVVGEMGGGDHQEQLALGEAPNIAARIQGLATPDTVLISADTYRIVQGYFTVEDLGPQTLKGVAQPLPMYRVLAESGIQTRFEVASTRGLTPLVGREDEVALLQRRWAQSRSGQGQVVLIGGEGGIGKSRLVEAVREQVTREGAASITFRCSPYHATSALYPIIEHMQRVLQLQRDDTPESKLDKLEQGLRMYDMALAEVVPLFAALCAVPVQDRYAPLPLSPQQQRQKTLEILVAWLLAEVARHPVLVAVEDLHWADPSTLELLSLLLEQVPTAPVLALLTYRPVFQPPWTMAAHLTQLTLNRFPPEHVERLATHVAGGKTLPTEVVQQVVSRTDGVPLFVEELTKTVLESGVLDERDDHYALTAALPALAIPTTLHDVLMARLDRLESAKTVAQLGAAIGRTFTYEMLQAMSPSDEATLQLALAQLVQAELLVQRGTPPQATYSFRHALIRDTAYESLLRRTRQQLHERIAQTLAERFPDIAATQPEIVAHHCTEAGLSTQALAAWQRAGRLASEGSAHQEAMAHLTKGLALIETLPDPQARLQHELTLQLTLGATLVKAKGHGSREVEQAYARARVLCGQMGDAPQLARVLYGLMGYYVNRATYGIALEVSEQLLEMAQRQQNPEHLLMAHNAMGTVLCYLGEYSRAHAHLEQGIALNNAERPRVGTRPGIIVPPIANLMYVAWTLWWLGYPDQALARAHEAVGMARESAHPFSITTTLLITSPVYLWRREFQVLQEHIDAACTLALEHGFTWWLALATINQGKLLAKRGYLEDGIAQMQAGMAAWRNHGSEVGRTDFIIWLAEAYGQVGDVDEGQRLLTEALAFVEQTQERYEEPELHRLKGELTLKAEGRGQKKELAAETCFQQALAIARHQQAKSWELRAAMSLSRLWQSQGKRQDARELLAPIYHWFTEGFDTADLQEAKVWLEALSR